MKPRTYRPRPQIPTLACKRRHPAMDVSRRIGRPAMNKNNQKENQPILEPKRDTTNGFKPKHTESNTNLRQERPFDKDNKFRDEEFKPLFASIFGTGKSKFDLKRKQKWLKRIEWRRISK